MRQHYKFKDLVTIMAQLRGPDGCPWDKEQSHDSLLKYLIEEAYEFIDTVHEGDVAAMRDELGDVLLQVVFHAQLASEAKTFDIEDVVQNICEKLVRRHPHVFGESSVKTSDAVIKQWEKIKSVEKGQSKKSSLLDGVPKSLPPLERAAQIQKKAARTGFDWQNEDGPLEKVGEELDELKQAIRKCRKHRHGQAEIEMEFGDLLFSMVNLARHLELDASIAIHKSTAKFEARFKNMESKIKEEGKDLSEMKLEEMDVYWDKVKAELNSRP